jgi:anti-sigma B factor antagonist
MYVAEGATMSIKTYLHGQIGLIELSGRFDAHATPALKTWQDQPDPPANVVVDLSGVTFIDSTALAVLVSGMKRCRQRGGDLHLCGLQQPVRIIFELTKLDRAFEIFPSSAEAISAFATPIIR